MTKRGHLELTNEDLLNAPEPIIAHGCNLRGTMGAGVALAIANRWPSAKKAYEYAVASGAVSLGNVVWSTRSHEELLVAHVMTQSSYGRAPRHRYVSYDAIDVGLRQVVDRSVSQFDSRVIGIPPIGLGLGGGSWPVVSAILEQIGEDLDVTFKIYVKDASEHARYEQLLRYGLVSA